MTLAGLRLLDRRVVVVAGRDEVGQSLAHVEEVAQALRGDFASAMRLRVSAHEPPPLYSLSRGTSVRVFVALPVLARGHVAGVVYASRTPNNVVKALYDERERLSVATLAVLGLTLLVGFVFHRAITGPMKELAARTQAIAAGDRSAMRPLAHHGTAEFAALSTSFLDMAQTLHRRSDFLATFAAHVSHELKSPLTAITGAAELMLDDLDPLAAGDPAMNAAERRRFLDNIVADAGRMTDILQRLRELARAESAPTAGFSRIDDLIKPLRAAFPSLDVTARGETQSALRISAENALIIFSHLADNAARHGATRLTIDAQRVDSTMLAIVADDGAGVSIGNRTRVFDSFFTTRRESGGTGMGLAIVRAMLQAHGGDIALLKPQRGAAFELTLPLV